MKQSKSRNIGIDALRILAIYMVLLLHIQGIGGIIDALETGTPTYYTSRLIETISICSVNVYALISGYVGIRSEFRYGKLLQFWAQIAFTGLVITALFARFRPETVSLFQWIGALFPFMSKQYWYMTAFFAVQALSPLLNAGLNHLTRRQFRLFFCNVLVFFSLIPVLFHGDPFQMDFGYSTLWILLLYLIGGGIRRFDPFTDNSPKRPALFFVLIIGLTWLSRIVIEYATLWLLGEAQMGGAFTGYTSPTIVLASVCLVLAFSKLQIHSPWAEKLIGFFGPATLGVYLIHCQPLVWDNIMKNIGVPFLDSALPIMVLQILGLAAALFVSLSLLDRLRDKLFQLLHINALCDRISKPLTDWIGGL